MKTTVSLTLLLLCSLLFTAKAATFPYAAGYPPADSAAKPSLLLIQPKAPETAMGKKLHWYERWQLKILQKKLAKRMQDNGRPVSKTIKVLSVISLVAAGLAIATLLAGSGVGLLFLLAGIVTGIIGLAGNPNRGEKHRTMAILGIVVSGLMILLIFVAILAWAGIWK